MSNRQLAAYGTEFGDLDEDQLKVSKKPTPIQDQIATDERGRRRFHGAFSGGFSAGYFNTVGSKAGWVPQEFKSSREDRSSHDVIRAEDIMDEEDLGEFGIGARRIRQSDAFSSKGDGKRRMAWEHDETSSSVLSKRLENIVKPVGESIGIHMLRTMGWREGRGVGMATTKQMKNRGGSSKEADFDREQASKVAPGHHLALEDELIAHLRSVEGIHGLGYQGLRQTTVLDEGYGKKTTAFKNNQKSRGIRGQAFGVGAFEDEDESVYSHVDLAQYDFAIEGPGKAVTEAPAIDSTFEEMPKRLNPRKFYPPPRLPANFKPEHKIVPLESKRMPDGLQQAMNSLTVVERARLLGEDRISVVELLKDADRKKLTEARRALGRSRWDQKPNDEEDRRIANDLNRIEFPDEPMKQSRFKEFLIYLRRGLAYPQPTDMSVWQWESEKKDFEAKLTSDERGMLPEVRSRSKPLAKSSLALPIQELLQSKFTKETGESGPDGSMRKDEDKMAAVKMGMFGERTRTMFQWYPANALAKRFNIPNPYPGASIVGVAHLQKSARVETILNLGLPNTANELIVRRHEEEARAAGSSDAKAHDMLAPEAAIPKEEEVTERPPDSIFKAIFYSDSSSSEESDSEDEKEKEKKRKADEKPEPLPSLSSSEPKPPPKKVFTVMDIEDEFGPAPPPSTSNGEEEGLTGFSVLRYLQEELARKKEKKRNREKHGKHRKSKKEKKSKSSKKSKKEKKSKKDKKEKKENRRRSPSDSSSGSSSDSDVVAID